MKKYQIAEVSIAVGLIISIVLSFVNFGAECSDIRNNVIRLHVLANSDSEIDQNVKQLVRDTLLSCGGKIFSGTVSKDGAEECLKKEKEMLTEKANKVLEENGLKYKAEIVVTDEYFQTRDYENFTLPAGEYKALKVILGKGEGHNWWCIMFPPLCLPAATEKTNTEVILGNNGAEIISNPVKYEMKFKVIELVEEIRYKIKIKLNQSKEQDI